MHDFIDYLSSIAAEGETVLLVKQKPKLVDGAMQFHGDGAIKCTWPAFLPERYKPGGAWYGNTACFIVSRFENGKVSASSANCEHVAFMVLDDIGTKSKIPPIEPTWKMETSPGNYQWGYAFALDDQPTKAAFSAAIKAVAEAGYTDAGAINPVRNFRLPGSVNLKPGKNEFASVLVEFHPEREFSLTAICEAMGVVPHEGDTAMVRKIALADDGTDEVMRWLRDTGRLIEQRNPEGWYGVTCPNAADHSDGNPEGRYNPLNRAYTCFHEHCGDWDSRRFLSWVAANGGPKHAPGIREELLTVAMAEALSKITPSSEFPDAAAEVIAEVERKEVGRLQKAEWYERFAYVQDDDAYFDIIDRREVSRSTFNALFRHVGCNSIHNGRRIEASVSFDENRQTKGARSLVGITYAAGDAVLVARDGDVYGNRWRDARPSVNKEAKSDIMPWLAHCEALIPELAEREHVFNLMAYKLQHPNVKINHAVLHGGDQGCGKDTLWAPMLWAVCGPGLKNRGLIDNDTLGSQWGYQLEAEIIILNELKEPEAKERRALANKLKPLIAAPPEMLTINRKGLHPYDMVNRAFVLAFSNDPVPITIDSQDRRWFCIWSAAPRMNPEAAAALWDWYRAGGFQAIAAWLYARDVSAFNPSAAPMWTEFKTNLIEQGMSIAESYLVDLLRSRKGEFAKGVIGSPFHALCDRLASGAPSGVKVPQAALLHALKEAEWVDLGRVSSGDLPSKKHLFCHPDMLTKVNKSELRRMVEESPGPRMAIVK
jgi:hypothetical protein